jgi:alcohol dehydrogenase
MKAAQINDYGGQEVLATTDNAPKPTAGPDQVLVEVYAAGVNPFDYKVREGEASSYMKLDLPATLGSDVAGVISELGKEETNFKVGDEVYGMASQAHGQGSYAEYTPVSVSQLSLKPSNVDFVRAAALPLTSISAYQALVDTMHLSANQKILIHGGGGGIGSQAIQIAKALGAYVATTVSATDIDYVKELGADKAIDYKSEDFSIVLTDFDAVYDMVGGETNEKSYKVLKPGGVFVSMVAPPNEEQVNLKNINYTYQQSKPTPERLEAIKKLVEDNKLKVHVDKIFSLEEASEALEYLKTGHPRGKVVIKVKDS